MPDAAPVASRAVQRQALRMQQGGPRDTYVLAVAGRRTGKRRAVPVRLIEADGQRWLVAPYGAVGWVHNVRAAEQVTLARGRRTETVRAVQANREEGFPALRQYVTTATIARRAFAVGPDAPTDAYLAIAPHHPVFPIVAAASPSA